MKYTRAISVLLAALLLTACSGQGDGDPAQTTAAVSGTVTAASESTAASETTGTSAAGSENGISSAESTGTTGSTASATASVTETGSTSGAGSTAVTAANTQEITAAVGQQTAAAPQTTAAQTAVRTTAAVTTARPVQTAAKPVTTSSSGKTEKISLPPEQAKVIDGLFKAHQSGKKEDFFGVSNLGEMNVLMDMYAGMFPDLLPEGFSLDDVLPQVIEKNLASYTVIYSADRPDIIEIYEQELKNIQDDIEDSETPELKENMQKGIAMLQGITKVCTVELNCKKTDGSEKVIGVPLYYQNGKWIADLFLYRYMSVPVTREEIRKKKMETAKTVWRTINRTYTSLAQQDTAYTVLEGRTITWKGDALTNKQKPEGNLADDPMQNLRYQAHRRNEELDKLGEIRFRLDNGQCTAAACMDADGFISYYPVGAASKEFSSLDDALAEAVKQAKN